MNLKECTEHNWMRIKTWEGDAAVPNGKNYFYIFKCKACGDTQDEEPENWEPEFLEPRRGNHLVDYEYGRE